MLVVPDALIEALCPDACDTTVEPLAGGVSATTLGVTMTTREGEARRVVVRHRPTPEQRLSITQEYELLLALHADGLPVPRPLLLWAADTMVMERVEGTTTLPAHGPVAMAEVLTTIHAHRGRACDGLRPREDPSTVLDAIGVPPPPPTAACLLHGDYWAANVIWRDDRLVAVIDWEDAAVGDPLSDVAAARVELEVAAGPGAAEAFTARYFATTGRARDGLGAWDLYVSTTALEHMDQWGLPTDVLEQRRTATQAFRRRATARPSD